LSLTGNHFIAVNHEDQYLPAHQIKSNDIVYINSQGQLKPVAVRNVTEEYRVGYFTPMTSQGKKFLISREKNSFISIRNINCQ
jgi:hypothetical protein